MNKHRAVKAVAPLFSLFDAYTDIAFPGGAHLSWFTENWGRLNATLDRNLLPPEAEKYKLLVTGVRPVDEDKDGSLLAGAIRDHAANWDVHQAASRIVFRDDIAPNAASVSIDAFSPHTYLKDLRASGAAVYGFSGWFDGAYQHAAIKRFLSLSNPAHKLIIGPWNHGGETVKILRLFCFAVLLIPMIVLIISGALMILNSNVGWLRYPLPGIFFVVYIFAGLSSPLIGIVALIVLAAKRHKFKDEAGREQRKLKKHIFVLALMNIFAVIAWVILFPLKFFSSCGSR